MMKTSLILLYLLTGLTFGYGLFGMWIAAHLARGEQIPPFFWIGLVGTMVLLIAIGVTVFLPRTGAIAGLIGGAVLWLFWGPILVAQIRLAVEAGAGILHWDNGLYSRPLLAATVLSRVFLAIGWKKASER